MRSETEEMLWIASQEDHLIPIQIINHAMKNGISMTKILDFVKEDLMEIHPNIIKRFFEKIEKIDEKKGIFGIKCMEVKSKCCFMMIIDFHNN